MEIKPITSANDPDWLRLRTDLWPHSCVAEHKEEMASFLAEPSRYLQLLARSGSNVAVGFAEASLRTDYVNGTESSPVAFLEGLYVTPAARRRGVARALVAEVAAWARSLGCSELASDTPIENLASQVTHARLGFVETERVVYFKIPLNQHQS